MPDIDRHLHAALFQLEEALDALPKDSHSMRCIEEASRWVAMAEAMWQTEIEEVTR